MRLPIRDNRKSPSCEALSLKVHTRFIIMVQVRLKISVQELNVSQCEGLVGKGLSTSVSTIPDVKSVTTSLQTQTCLHRPRMYQDSKLDTCF